MKHVPFTISSLVVLLFAYPVFAGQASSAAAPEVFTYSLSMSDVDTVQNARVYETKGGSLVGLRDGYTATKRLPFKIGPGPVRAYIWAYPEARERRFSLTIAGQTRSAVLSAKTPRYHHEELVFDLPEATDKVDFKAESVDGENQRIVWYNTLLTNDPEMQHVEVASGAFRVLRRPENIVNPSGNLIPNSGFEEGIHRWDITGYKSNIMAKPSLLNPRAAHGQHSMDVGQIPITTRWFVLEPDQKYTLSFYVATNAPTPVEVRIEAKTKKNQDGVIRLDSVEDAGSSDRPGWKRVVRSFTLPPDPPSDGNQYRLVLRADGESQPALVDSFQIVEGAQPGVYAPHLGLEANFISPTTQAIFVMGTPSDLYFNLAASEATTIQSVHYRVTDYFDREVQAEKALDISVAGRLPVTFDTTRAGLFRIRTRIDYTWQGQARTAWRDRFYNVVHPSHPRKDRLAWSLFGCYFTAAPQGPYSYAEIANRFGIYEFNTLGHPMGRWNDNVVRRRGDSQETPQEKYNFSNADKEWQRFRDANINTIVNFHVNAVGGSYSIVFGLNSEGDDTFEFKNGVTFDKAEWLDFVSAYATHFKGRIKRYVIQDEPYQYFSAEQYAIFYLATYRAMKKADPDAMVFMHNAHGKMEYIEELNTLTDGKAHEAMDGVYLYLTQQHSGAISRTAVPEFRRWVRLHKLPVLTATCFSGGRNFSKQPVHGAPAYMEDRSKEFRSIQHMLDGVIWGQSQAYYYYYGSHPSGDYASPFDKQGQIIPLIHFYSAANAMIGDVVASQSIDAFDALRIGVIQTARGASFAVLYSVDGKLYELSAAGAKFKNALDGFGNPIELRRDADEIKCVVGPQPLYLAVSDATKAAEALAAARLEEKITMRFGFGRHESGALQLRIFMECDEPLEAWAQIHDVIRPEEVSIAHSKKVSDGVYELAYPLPKSPLNSLTGLERLRLSTNLGDLYAAYRPDYASLCSQTTTVDGTLQVDEWPTFRAQTIPLQGTYMAKGERTPYTPGYVALTYDKTHLCGAVALVRGDAKRSIVLEIVPQDTRLCVPLVDRMMRIQLDRTTGSVVGQPEHSVQVASAQPDAYAQTQVPGTAEIIEFSVPLAALPGLKMRDGISYSLRVNALDEPLSEGQTRPARFLDAGWPSRVEDQADPENGRWGTMMVQPLTK